VILRSDHSGRGIQDVCHLNLVVQAEGIEPAAEMRGEANSPAD
jgi:hypothetical protein